jgi:hypothetical protein
MSVCELTVLSCIDAADDGRDAVGVLSCHNKLVIYTSSIRWSKQLLHQTIKISWVAYCIVFIQFGFNNLI